MSTVPIKSPASPGAPFPDTISGEFTLAVVTLLRGVVYSTSAPDIPQPPPGTTAPVVIPPPVISVWVKQEDTGVFLPVLQASVSTPKPNASSGTWQVAKPAKLTPGKCYTITATLSHQDYTAANSKVTKVTT